jgi:hypothetical protein
MEHTDHHTWAAAKLAWLLARIARDFEAAAAALRKQK